MVGGNASWSRSSSHPASAEDSRGFFFLSAIYNNGLGEMRRGLLEPEC